MEEGIRSRSDTLTYFSAVWGGAQNFGCDFVTKIMAIAGKKIFSTLQLDTKRQDQSFT